VGALTGAKFGKQGPPIRAEHSAGVNGKGERRPASCRVATVTG
jgi:hypothetical protein